MKSGVTLRVEDLDHVPDDGNRYELIDGDLFASPSPRLRHQRFVGNLFRELSNFVIAHGMGEVLVSPFDLILDPQTVVEPDLIYVSEHNRDKVTDCGVEGAPDLVVEVLSPSTADIDKTIKFRRFERARIPEYWIVDTEELKLTQYRLDDGNYVLVAVVIKDGTLGSSLFPGLSLPLEPLFQKPIFGNR